MLFYLASEFSLPPKGIVAMSETDSDGGKKHYLYQLGPDAGMKHNTHRKSPVPTEYSEYSEKLATPLSEEIKERYPGTEHTQLENVTGYPDRSRDIQLPEEPNSVQTDPRSLGEQNKPPEVSSPKNIPSNEPTTQIPDVIPKNGTSKNPDRILPLSLPLVDDDPKSMHITTNPDVLTPLPNVEEERKKDYLVNSITGEIASFYPSQVNYSYFTTIQEKPSIPNSTSMQSTGSGPSMISTGSGPSMLSNQDSFTSSTEKSAQFPHLAHVDPLERLPPDLMNQRVSSPKLQPNDNPSPNSEFKSCDPISDFKSMNSPVSPRYLSLNPVSAESEQKPNSLSSDHQKDFPPSDFMSIDTQEVSMTRSLSLMEKDFKNEDSKELYDQELTPRSSPLPVSLIGNYKV